LIQEVYLGNASGEFEDLDGDGRLELILGEDTFAYFKVSFADSPIVKLILHMDENTFRDVGAEFSELYDARISSARGDLNAIQVKSLDDLDGEDDNYERAKGGILSIVINYLYSGRMREAREAFDEFWHADPEERTRTREEIRRKYCGALRGRLAISGGDSCTTGVF
jgi:hypothetical protein